MSIVYFLRTCSARDTLQGVFMVRPGGFEPLAFGVGVQRSIQLSYDRTYCRCFSISKKEYTILLHKLQMEFLSVRPLTRGRGMGILKS